MQDYRGTYESMILWAEQAGVLKIKEDRVEYMLAKVKSYRLTDPEERVRAEFCVELVGRYGYPKERIDLEVEVPRREPKDKADIVVYEDDKLKAPYVVAECKRDGIAPNDIKQAVEQVFGNAHSLGAKYAIVVAGSVRLAFDVAGFPSMERERNIVADIPIKYGKVVKFKYKRSDDEWDLREVDRNEILAKFQQCHDTLWEAGKRNPAEAFDEMSKLMFCKIHDERFLTKKGEHYRFQIGTHEEIKDVAERVKKIYQDAQKVDPDVFLDPIKAEDPIIYGVVEVLQRISLSKTDLDAKGVAFEHFLGSVFRGEMGQYFTPRPIVEFMVDVLHPDENDFVIDPACGSGGFLLYTLDKVKRHLEYSLSPRDADYRWRNFGLKQLFGIEINSQLARVAMINMIIHEDGHSNIESNDSLDNPQRFNPRRDMRLGKYTLLLTNPPFGAVTIQREKPYLSEYELGGKRKKRKRQNTEILFIERCLDFLAPMGRIGIVLPDGILTNASLQYVRDFVLDSGQILAVVSLPHTTFVHYGSGVKSSLVFIRKKIDGEVLSSDYHIFMAIAEHVGYDATGRPTDNDLPSILKSWKDFDENRRIGLISDRPLCFSVRRDELENALNPARYSVTPPEQVNWAALISYGQVIYDTIQPRKYPQKIFDVIRIDDLENNCHEAVNLRTLYGESLKGIYQNVLPNDVLITRLGPGILNKKSLVCSFTANEAIASTEFIVFRPRQGVNPWGILAILKTDYFKELMYSKCRGATPSRFRLVRDDFEALQFPSMKEATIDSIGRRFLQNRERAKFLRIEAQKLVTDIHDDVQKTLLKGK